MYIDTMLECFEIKRIMLGPDWTVGMSARTYSNLMQIAVDYFWILSRDEQAHVWSENAKTFYGIVD